MSVQGYIISFVPKKGRPPNPTARSGYLSLSSSLCDFAANVAQFQPDNKRASDGKVIEEMNNEKGLITVQNALNNILAHAPCRVICAPSEELKSIQGDILRELERIPVHRAAHGFVRGRDALSCAQAHLSYWGKQPKGLVLLNADVSGFFHSISRDLVITALTKHGISEANSQTIADHCMMRASPELSLEAIRNLGVFVGHPKVSLREIIITIHDAMIWDNPVVESYRHVISKTILSLGPAIVPGGCFLPQGSPTSPVLSNLVCKIIDIRLTAMAKAFGAFYTRYADDITFSWPAFTKGKVIDGLKRCSAEVFKEYGMNYHPNKIRVIGPGGAQDIVGYVINSGKPTISQKFRKSMRDSVLKQLKSPKPTPDCIVNRLVGQAGYIQPLHPKEATWIKEQVEALQFKTNRKVRTPNHAEETIEPPASTHRRKVITVD